MEQEGHETESQDQQPDQIEQKACEVVQSNKQSNLAPQEVPTSSHHHEHQPGLRERRQKQIRYRLQRQEVG